MTNGGLAALVAKEVMLKVADPQHMDPLHAFLAEVFEAHSCPEHIRNLMSKLFISGSRWAVRRGEEQRIGELAEQHQVLCITHLPQIAAFADVHFRIDKQTRGGRTHATIERVDGDARVDEIARMAGGEAISEATRRHARDLLKVKSVKRQRK